MRLVLRLAVIGGAIAWIADTVLRRQAGGAPPEPVRLLVVVDAPIERVWAELIDIEGQPRWMHDMKTVRMDEPGPLRIGARGEGTVGMYGMRVNDPVSVSVLEPPNRFGVSHEGTFSGSGVFDLERGADGTTTIVRWQEDLRSPVLPHFAAVVTAPLFRHVFQADLERFRALVERTA